MLRLKILTVILIGNFALIFIINHHCLSKEINDRAWRYSGYDLLDTHVYPYPSKHIKNPQFKLKNVSLRYDEHNHSILAGDVTGDEKMEVCVSVREDIEIYDDKLQNITTISTPFISNALNLLEDIDKDGKLDLGTGFSKYEEIVADFYNYKNELLLHFTESVNKQPEGFAPLCILNGNLVSYVNSGFNRFPRRIISHNCESRTKNWHYRLGTITTGRGFISAADINNDGVWEISIYNASPENGSVGNGGSSGGIQTHDDCTYTLVINENGSEYLTIRESAKSNNEQYSKFVKLKDDSPYSLLCYNSPANNSRPLSPSKVFLRDIKHGELIRTFYGKARYDLECIACDIDGNGVKEFIVSNYDDELMKKESFSVLNYILDDKLSIINYTSNIPGIIKCANDLDGDGLMELIFQNEENIFITENDFTILFEHSFPKPIKSNIIIIDVGLDGYNEIYLATKPSLYKITIVDGN